MNWRDTRREREKQLQSPKFRLQNLKHISLCLPLNCLALPSFLSPFACCSFRWKWAARKKKKGKKDSREQDVSFERNTRLNLNDRQTSLSLFLPSLCFLPLVLLQEEALLLSLSFLWLPFSLSLWPTHTFSSGLFSCLKDNISYPLQHMAFPFLSVSFASFSVLTSVPLLRHPSSPQLSLKFIHVSSLPMFKFETPVGSTSSCVSVNVSFFFSKSLFSLFTSSLSPPVAFCSVPLSLSFSLCTHLARVVPSLLRTRDTSWSGQSWRREREKRTLKEESESEKPKNLWFSVRFVCKMFSGCF